MEQFIVYPNGLNEMGAYLKDGCAHHCFRLLVVEFPELRDRLVEIFGSDITLNDVWEQKARSAPVFVHVGPDLHYVCFNDLNDGGQKSLVRFFLTENIFILVNWGWLKPQQIAAWAERGMLEKPLDIALNLGFFILSHHQDRLEQIEQEMDYLEVEILKGPRAWQQAQIIELHRKVLGLKKSLNLHQSVFIRLAEFQTSAGPALWKDLVADTQRELDNVRQMHDLVENLREAYQAAVDNRSNDIMKLLTLLATILLPINLMTSFFGMNFKRMPLIDKAYGLPVFYTFSILIAAIAFWYFWRRKWLK